jgi:hypothetical protein
MDVRIDARPLEDTAGRPLQTTVDTADGLPVSMVLLDTVAEAIGMESLLREPPLYDVIDPDALDALFASAAASERADTSVVFEFAGCEVTVCSPNDVLITQL